MTAPDPADQTSLVDLKGYYAGFISRAAAFLCDVAIISIIITLTSWISYVTLSTFTTGSFFGISAEDIPMLEPVMSLFMRPGTAGLVILLFIISYHTLFWFFAGQTPGKALLGLRVVTMEGKRVSILRGILRYFAYYLSAIPILLGFWWILVDDQRQGWHDKIARTVVIYTWAARPDERFMSQEISTMNSDLGIEPDSSPTSLPRGEIDSGD
jgi:uncharacterized RDD family membrane protein YckC